MTPLAIAAGLRDVTVTHLQCCPEWAFACYWLAESLREEVWREQESI